MLSAAAGAAVGIVLSGQVGGAISTAVSQAILIDASQFDEKDISAHAKRRFGSVSDDQTSFTAAAEISTGDEVAIDVPLVNLSTDTASVELTLQWPPQVQVNAEPFWTSETFTRSLTEGAITRTFTTPAPAPFTATDEQSKNAALEVETQPAVSATIFFQTADGGSTTDQPAGTPAPAANISEATSTNTAGDVPGSEPVSPQIVIVEPPGASPLGATLAPGAVYRSGTFSVDLDDDGSVDTSFFVVIDLDGDGDIDQIELSYNPTFRGRLHQ